MPANLNALIRYRTIDQCLSNPYRKWTIGDLGEACAAALKEHRGIYSGISERTIREDIRVMRSDILGFNAPIVQSGGYYSYEDREYSIFKVAVRNEALLTRILKFMMEIRSEVNHPDMDRIIQTISEAIPKASAREVTAQDKMAPESESLEQEIRLEEKHFLSEAFEPYQVITWAWLFETINKQL